MNERIFLGESVLVPATRWFHGPAGSVRLFPQCARLLEALAHARNGRVSVHDLIAAIDAGKRSHPDVDRGHMLRNTIYRTRQAMAHVGTRDAIAGERRGRGGWRLVRDPFSFTGNDA